MSLARTSMLAAAAAMTFASFASAATIATDSFDSAATWTVVKGDGVNIPPFTTPDKLRTQSADFGFDYATSYGIAAAPSGTSTTGLRLRSNLYGGVLSGVATYLQGVSLPSTYVMKFDVYSSAVNGGVNSSEAASYGVADGTRAQVSANATGYSFAAVRDSLAGPYRNYVNNGTAGAQVTAASQTANFLAKTVTQTGTLGTNTVGVAAGYASQAWRTVTITNDGTNITWQITNDIGGTTTLKTVALSTLTNLATATTPFVGSYDTSAGSSIGGTTTTTNPTDEEIAASLPATFNFELYDNLVISTFTAVPEPTTLAAIAGLGMFGLVRRRKA